MKLTKHAWILWGIALAAVLALALFLPFVRNMVYAIALLGMLGMPRFLDNLSKLIIDTILYFLSYRVQNKWIFREDKA